MEDERFIFMRKLLTLCNEYKVDLMGDDSSIVAHRNDTAGGQFSSEPWIEDLHFRFSGERGSKELEVKMAGYWDGELHEVIS